MADRLRALRQEVEAALLTEIPDDSDRAEAVDWLFQCDPRAPFELAVERLTGVPVDSLAAPAVWRHTLEIQHRWSGRLREAVTLRAAASEAVIRATESDAPPESPAAPSLQPYLDRDLLTGLFNRAFYEQKLTHELEQSDRTGQPVSLLLIEIGGLAEIAQQRPRAEHDDLLRSLGEQVRFHFRPTDIPCRTSDAEVTVLLPATPPNVAHAMAESFVEVTQQRHKSDSLALAIGVATYREDAASGRALEKAAAMALRRAGSLPGSVATYSHGRGRVQRPVAAVKRSGAGPARTAGMTAAALLLVGGIFFGIRSFTSSSIGPEAGSVTPLPRPAPSVPVAVTPPRNTPALRPPAPPKREVAPVTAAVPGATESLLTSARPRVDGDYSLAAARLAHLAAEHDLGFSPALAFAAAGAARAAIGADPAAALHPAAVASLQAPSAQQPGLRARIALIRAEALDRRQNLPAAESAYRGVIQNQAPADVRMEAGVELVLAQQRQGQAWGASNTASALAAGQGDPAVRAALQAIAAGSQGKPSGALQLALVQPGLLQQTGILGDAARAAVARDLVPNGRAALQGSWRAPLNTLSTFARSAGGGAAPLRVAAADRLLAVADPAAAHELLEHDLRSDGLTASGAGGDALLRARALFLDGVARRELGDASGAHDRWSTALHARSSFSPAVWTPAPDEQWWPSAAALMLGQESPAAFMRLMSLEGKERSQLGWWYLKLASHPGARIPGPQAALPYFRPTMRRPGGAAVLPGRPVPARPGRRQGYRPLARNYRPRFARAFAGRRGRRFFPVRRR